MTRQCHASSADHGAIRVNPWEGLGLSSNNLNDTQVARCSHPTRAKEIFMVRLAAQPPFPAPCDFAVNPCGGLLHAVLLLRLERRVLSRHAVCCSGRVVPNLPNATGNRPILRISQTSKSFAKNRVQTRVMKSQQSSAHRISGWTSNDGRVFWDAAPASVAGHPAPCCRNMRQRPHTAASFHLPATCRPALLPADRHSSRPAAAVRGSRHLAG